MTDVNQSSESPPGSFPVPPGEFTDAEGRQIRFRVYGSGPLTKESAEFDAVVSFYSAFDPADRAQGIPPSNLDRIREWLTSIFTGDTVHVLAWHDNQVVGHATLVPDGDGLYELAIFVLQTYQGAGIGSELIRYLLGTGVEQGITEVWLTVERWNEPAIRLYKTTGFEITNTESFELEMGLQLDR